MTREESICVTSGHILRKNCWLAKHKDLTVNVQEKRKSFTTGFRFIFLGLIQFITISNIFLNPKGPDKDSSDVNSTLTELTIQ